AVGERDTVKMHIVHAVKITVFASNRNPRRDRIRHADDRLDREAPLIGTAIAKIGGASTSANIGDDRQAQRNVVEAIRHDTDILGMPADTGGHPADTSRLHTVPAVVAVEFRAELTELIARSGT